MSVLFILTLLILTLYRQESTIMDFMNRLPVLE